MHFQMHVPAELAPIPVFLHFLQHHPAMLAVPWLKVASTPLKIQALYLRSQSPCSRDVHHVSPEDAVNYALFGLSIDVCSHL
jgi:hypothetical protein